MVVCFESLWGSVSRNLINEVTLNYQTVSNALIDSMCSYKCILEIFT